jgi:hypothetical protein
MKGIVKYQQKFYTKSKNTRGVKKGDLIKLECQRKSSYFKYNGIYTVETNFREIRIPNYEGNGIALCLKLGYNVGYDDFVILKLSEKKRSSLPMPVKDDMYEN